MAAYNDSSQSTIFFGINDYHMINDINEVFTANYTDIKYVASGNYSQVYKVIPSLKLSHKIPTKLKNTKFAAKFYDLQFREDLNNDQIQKEIEALNKLSQSVFIVKLFDKFFSESKMQVVLIMEYCKTSLFEAIENVQARFTEQCFISVSVPILKGLEAIHSNDIIHRDLRSNNILIKSDNSVVISDFGLASLSQTALSFVGSPHWMAPEIVQSRLYNMKVDIWSWGITIFELCFKNHPYLQTSNLSVIYQVIHNYPPKLNPNLFPKLSIIYDKVLVKDPTVRHSSTDLLNLDIFTNSPNYFDELLSFFGKESKKDTKQTFKTSDNLPPKNEAYEININLSNQQHNDDIVTKSFAKQVTNPRTDYSKENLTINQYKSHLVDDSLSTQSKNIPYQHSVFDLNLESRFENTKTTKIVKKYSSDCNNNQELLTNPVERQKKINLKFKSSLSYPIKKKNVSCDRSKNLVENKDGINVEPKVILSKSKYDISKLLKNLSIKKYKYNLQQDLNFSTLDNAHKLALDSLDHLIEKNYNRIFKLLGEKFKAISYYKSKRLKTIHSSIKDYARSINNQKTSTLKLNSLHRIHSECKIELVHMESLVCHVFNYIVEEIKYNSMIESFKNFQNCLEVLISNTKTQYFDLITRKYSTIMCLMDEWNDFETECFYKHCLILINELFRKLFRRLKKSAKNVKASECLDLYPKLKTSYQNLIYDVKDRTSSTCLSLQEKFLDERINVIIEHVCSDRNLHQIDEIIKMEIDELNNYWNTKQKLLEKNKDSIKNNSESPNLIIIQYKQIANETFSIENFEKYKQFRDEINEFASKIKLQEMEYFELSKKYGVRNIEFFNQIKKLIHIQFCKKM